MLFKSFSFDNVTWEFFKIISFQLDVSSLRLINHLFILFYLLWIKQEKLFLSFISKYIDNAANNIHIAKSH